MMMSNPNMPAISDMDYWSDTVVEVQLTATAQDITIGNVVVEGIPVDSTIIRVIAMFKARAVENTNVAANEIEATAQDIEVKENAAGTWTDAINITQGSYKVAGETREMMDVVMGNIDIKAEVDGNATYNFRWKDGEAILANLQFNDAQVGLRVYLTRP